jgi:bifunctional non-homologous end joining protein LigD
MSKIEEKPIIWNVGEYKLQITHPNKIYWPKEGYTKLDILQYYMDMAPILLPYFKERPVTIHYFPKGIEEFSFYKRNFEDEEEDENLFHTISYEEISQDKTIRVPLIDTAAGLLFFASKGGIEFHLWSSKVPNYSYPDIAIFDFDVNENVAFEKVLQAASYLNEFLNSMGLKSYPKTTGGSGLHVYLPIVPEYSFKEVREWVKSISDTLAKKYPDLITTQRKSRKTHISDKVTVDYLQNVISRNTAAPYTVRAYPNAPVSTPLTWKEVKKGGFRPKDFNIKTIPKRVEKLGDLFSEVLKNKQTLE